MIVMTCEREDSVVLCVVGMGGEGILIDRDRMVFEYEVSHEVVEKVDWIFTD